MIFQKRNCRLGSARSLAFMVIISSVLIFSSCTSELTLELKKDGSVQASFTGLAGQAFAALSGLGGGVSETGAGDAAGDASVAGNSVIFNTAEIEYEMAGNGFSEVKAASKNGSDISVKACDKNAKSVLFTSGIVSVQDGKLMAQLSPQKLMSFYEGADSQTVMFLDMLLSPVFNQEVMSEEEYIETLQAFYGQEIADEIQAAKFKITLINTDGSQTVQNVSLPKLLTLNETLVIR